MFGTEVELKKYNIKLEQLNKGFINNLIILVKFKIKSGVWI